MFFNMFLFCLKGYSETLRLIQIDHEISFLEILRNNNDMANHQRNIRILQTEVFKATKNLSPPIMEGTFNSRPKN